VICGLRHRVTGLEHLPDGPCIVLCKHQSTWETISLRAILPLRQAWVLKRELLRIPIFGWALSQYRPIAIDRSAGRQAMRQLLAQGQEHIANGRWVVVFPEGTRVAAGERRRYNIGGAMLAEKTGAPVVPIAHNAGFFWRRRGVRKFPGTIDVVIGKPITTTGRKASEINAEVEGWIEGTVAQLPGYR
jgi:1-acyl-sn-glycerol-3-phosphate acyltransferase